MTPTCDIIHTDRNPFIGAQWGKRGRVMLKVSRNKVAIYTPLRPLRIIPKVWPFVDADIPVLSTAPTEMPATLKAELDAWQAARDEALESIEVPLPE